MNKICDIYLIGKIKGESLLSVMSPDMRRLDINVDRNYSGFLGIELPRLRGVALVVELRRNGISSLNVPIDYRKKILLSDAEIIKKAKNYVSEESSIWMLDRSKIFDHPMMANLMTDDEKFHQGGEGGGVIVVDRLDGHCWGADELEDYSYDYNNIL